MWLLFHAGIKLHRLSKNGSQMYVCGTRTTMWCFYLRKHAGTFAFPHFLTHWGRVTHICFSKLTIIGSDNGLSPGRRQAIIWTNAGILLIRVLGTNFSEILSAMHTISFKKMHLKMSSAKWRLFSLGLNMLKLRYGEQLKAYLAWSVYMA